MVVRSRAERRGCGRGFAGFLIVFWTSGGIIDRDSTETTRRRTSAHNGPVTSLRASSSGADGNGKEKAPMRYSWRIGLFVSVAILGSQAPVDAQNQAGDGQADGSAQVVATDSNTAAGANPAASMRMMISPATGSVAAVIVPPTRTSTAAIAPPTASATAAAVVASRRRADPSFNRLVTTPAPRPQRPRAERP